VESLLVGDNFNCGSRFRYGFELKPMAVLCRSSTPFAHHSTTLKTSAAAVGLDKAFEPKPMADLSA